jgi:hypothetical protein
VAARREQLGLHPQAAYELAVNVLCGQGYPVRDEDAARLSPLGHAHIPAPNTEQNLRPLRDPGAAAG